MMKDLLRISITFVLIASYSSRFFQDGFDHFYVYKATSDFLGMHNVTTIIKFNVHRLNTTNAGDYLNVLTLNSFVQFSQSGQYADNPLQWNLSRPFLFTVTPTGIVLHVHVHPEEEEEVSALKKVISGTFSAHVLVKNDSQWTYTRTDSDHIGTLEHEYTGTKTGTGIQLRRYHRSVENVERLHVKTMSLDHHGTVESVDGEDSIILENRLNSDFETKRVPYPEEYVIKTTEEGDIGVMKANAQITMKLISKRRIKEKTKSRAQYHGLQRDSNLLRQEKVQKESLASLEKHIQAAINCSHLYSDKSNTNRTICVNTLRQNVTSLNEKDYVSLVSKFLARVCEQNDTRCEDERLLFTDIVARAGDEISQQLVVRYVFQTEPLDEEAVRRALIHLTTLEQPIWATVTVVENLCFGAKNEQHGSVKMPLTVRRACLTLGVLAKALSKNDNDTAAVDILEKLHAWLYEQGDETPEHLRPRRSTINVDTKVSSDHLLSKFVLLHSLGNAAHQSSVPHLHEYATPNARIPAWRRAALAALKFDKGNKTYPQHGDGTVSKELTWVIDTAQVLLDSLTYDKVETVRATAMEQFLAHPLQHNVSKSLGDVLLSQNYSYPTVLRLKRSGDLNAVLLEFKIELPEVHWGRSVGNKQIGASFGVDMVNRMHLRIKPLSGFFHINIWDRVYAEAHVGLLGIHVDILRIEACYRGKLEYNLNILKDFSYGEAQKDFDEYDKAAGEIVTPVVDAVEGILDLFKTSSGHQSVFQPLTDAVKEIPVQARHFLESSLALLNVLDRYQGIPLVSRARLLAFKVQGLAEDIKADTLNFYNEIADTALIVLPHAEIQITEAANMMIDAQKKLGSNPQQAFETLNKAKQRIKYATYQIIKAKATIQDALSPHGGSLPTWISSQEEIKMAITAARTLLIDIKTKQAYFAAVATEEIEYYVEWQGLEDIQHALEKVIDDMENLNAGVKPFHIVVTDKLKEMQKIKLSVDKLDKKTQETQNTVKKNFGPKFTKQFPAQRREPDSKCEGGIWPSTTGGRYKDTPGIDVIVEQKSKVVCPVNGKVYLTCNDDEVRIIPSDDTFKMFTIFIRNIDVLHSVHVNGTEFKAGQPLGHGRGKSGCSDPYIHVAMRKMSENGASGCSYVDPSSYVDNIKPFPKWQEECKEFVFKHIGNIIEAGLSGLGFEDIVEELAKRALAWAGAGAVKKIVSHFPKSAMAKMAGTMAFAYLSQYNSEITNAFMTTESQKALMEEKCEEMKMSTTPATTIIKPPPESSKKSGAGNEPVTNIIEALKVNSTTTQKSLDEIQTIIKNLKSSSTGMRLDDMSSMAFSKYGKILEKLNIPSKGSKQSMETTLQMLSWKVCPTFENGIAQGYGHVCVPSDDCFSLNCTIRIPHGLKKEKISLAAHFDRSDSTFIIHTRHSNKTIKFDDSQKQFDILGIMSDYSVTILSHPKSLNTSVGQVFQLTLSAVVCDLDARCLPEIHIFHNLTFLKRSQQRQIRSSDGCSFGANIGIENVGHIGGSIDVDKNGHVTGGDVDLGVKAGNVDIGGGLQINDQGEWGVTVGADVDLGDGNTVGTEMSLEGDGETLTAGLVVDAQFGDKGSIGGFIQGNSDGQLTAGVQGSVNTGSANVSAGTWIHHDKNGTSGGGSVSGSFGGKGHVQASVNRSANGAIDAGLTGGVQINNTTLTGGGFIHHDKNGTSGGAHIAANVNGKGEIAASVNGSADGSIDAGVSGSANIGNSTISGAGYIHHDKNGTSGGGIVAANIDGKGHIGASLNASSDGSIDAGLGGSAQIGNSTISGAGYVHHDKNGTSGGGVVDANIDGKGHIGASLNASSDGSIDAGLGGSAQIGNSTISGAGYVHHDKNGTSGGGVVDANIDGKGHIGASLNASSDGSIDAGLGGSAQIGNSTISGAGYVHHDKNGTSGGGVVNANIDGKGHIGASLNASSDGSIDAGLGGSAQIGNSTISGAGYVHHDKNGTSGGGVLDANIGEKGHIGASLNASSDGSIDAGLGGSAQIGNSTISGAGYLHHDKNGTSGGGVVDANIDGKGHIGASLNASSDGSIDAGLGGSAQIGNSTISGAGYIHHDKNGTSGGGVVDANIDGKGQIGASLNASSDGSIDAGLGGSAHIGNSSISGAGYIHHDKNGTSGGGVVDANIDGKGQIGASLNASSDGSIDAGLGGSARIGNSTISGAGYIHHDKNGTSGGGVVDANIDGKGHIGASFNASSDGSIDAGLGGSAHIGNSTISGAGYLHHDKNGTSGGGQVDANIDGKGHIGASLNASSDGSIDAGLGGSARIGNATISGAGYLHHDKNGTSGGGQVDANIDGKGHIGASLNASSDGSIDAGLGGSAQIGNSTISGAGYVHHDKNGTSGGGIVDANIDGKGNIGASLNASSDGSIDAGLGGSALIGNSTISGAGYVHHDKNGTSGGGQVDANIDGKGHIGASLNASSDGSIDAGLGGLAQIGNSTISGAGYLHHDKNGTSGGGQVDANIDGKGHIGASLNASSDGSIDAGLGGSAHIGNSTISGAGYLHHDKNGTSGGGQVDANVDGKGHITASLNRSSGNDFKAGLSIGNTSIIGNLPIQTDENDTTEGDVHITKRDTLSLTADNDNRINDLKVSEIHHVNVRSAGKCSVDLSTNFGDGKVDIGAEANIPGFGKLGAHATIKDGQLQGEIAIGDISFDLGEVQKLTMDTFNQLANDMNLNTDATHVLSGFRDGTRHQVCTTETEMSVGYDTEVGEEDFPARDKKDGVVYKDKHIDITIFKLSHTFGIGPIGIKLSFGAGGAIGTDMWSDIHANKGTAGFSIGPWVSGMVWGGLSIELGIASGGIKLVGYILKTKFPVTMETKSNKHPLTVVMNIDLELTPIELSLRGWAKVFFAKVFDKCLWKWACPPIKWNILRKELENKDEVPPKFVTGSFCGDYRGKRAVQQCSIRQITNRHPSDTAYQLEVSATDEDSSVKTWYAIGLSPGGRDVQQWTKFKGDNQVVPSKLPNGVPLYFTVKAQNQQGLESFLQCRLDTYDNTLPDGRIEASHKFSSHPGKITATVIVSDDSPLEWTHKALGLSPGKYGREIEDWTILYLSRTTSRVGISSDLKHFSIPRKGKLIIPPFASDIKRTPELCAKKCLASIKCLSFDYGQVSETCQLHDVVQSHSNSLHISGDFNNYERLGGGFTAFVEYQNQPLEHGTVYYVNVLTENTLKYRSALFSEGTLVDFTPPMTGDLGKAVHDVTVSHYCKASVRQRCEEVTDLPNHRMVIDGPEGRTVFSGNKPLFDAKYTLTNHYVTANWDGFTDPESGIWGFSWAVGTTVCGQEIVKFVDPHRHISSPKYWTYSGFHEDVDLPDGEYYVTVEALNNVVFGGALVTTVCHSVPFTVDTTPPFFHKITDVMFDEDFDILAAYYNVSDGESGISRVDFGLGMTKHDVGLRAYSRHGFLDRSDPYLVIENLELQPGVPAWVRLRAVNNVGLFASGHAEAPIMVDKTPPVPGTIFDGDVFKVDIQYQSDTENICAQWKDFYDPESGIKRFIWGAGTQPELDDVVAFRNISRFDRQVCEKAKLSHNMTYYSTVVALNDALNSKRSNSSSDGVLVDITPPLRGIVDDRYKDPKRTGDIDFTSETATVVASWHNFSDPESEIDHYDISIEINNEKVKTVPMSTATWFQDHSLTLNHLDYIEVKVSASNGANLQTTSSSDGILVDHTPPIVQFIHDTNNGKRFQSENTKLNLKWEFSDPESDIAQYRYQVNEIDAGIRTTIFPSDGDFTDIYPESATVSMELDKLHLNDGAVYKVHLIAFNKARLSSSHESDGVLVDTTPPIVKNVKLSMPKEEEDLDETDTYVLLAGSDSLTVSWIARDSESGILEVKVGIGVFKGDTSVTNGYARFNGRETHAVFRELSMQYFADESPVFYYVSVIAINYAGLHSDEATSKPIKILHENVPGIVYDGRDELKDADFTRDKTSLGISFNGFESETCNIVGYEWAVGTEPYLTDILPFTDYGIVMINESQGHAQIHLELYESQIYYASVRARTGQMCDKEFIMSVSDGITLDTNGPEITLNLQNKQYSLHDNSYLKQSIFQQSTDNIEVSWKATDDSGISLVAWMIGNLPGTHEVHDITSSKGSTIPLKSISLGQGKANFLAIKSNDISGLSSLLVSPAITVDTSVPEVDNFLCTNVLSDAKSVIGCEWSMVSDSESPIISLAFGISYTPLGVEILNFTDIAIERRNWYRDVRNFIIGPQVAQVYIALRIRNAAGKEFIIEETAIVDRTPPADGNIRIVTRDSLSSPVDKILCQSSEQYIEIEVKGFVDKESGLARYDIGLGSSLGATDILPYKAFAVKENILIDGLQIIPGTVVFASVKVYNDVNLFSTHFSHEVVVSPSPKLSVIDGDKPFDQDFLSQLNVIQGQWQYSDPCPIQSVEWAIEDLVGNTIQKFKPILNANTHFLNDEIRTGNDKTYINIIRTRDALNRTRLARSDGITVRIQPPKFANVRDGLEREDINYQRSTSELSGNWDEFGETTERIPSQIIVKYEVAVGNDRRYPNTRTNVQGFIDVGMNKTVTFTNLNLKAKLVRYYLTVRAYSAAGSFIEGFSNGIRVGYEEMVKPGDLKYSEFQSSTDRIDIGWSSFISDYGIRHYETAAGRTKPNTTNDTVECSFFKSKFKNFDIQELQNVGLNTYSKIKGLSLVHGKIYFVTVLAEDESGSCISVTSGPILIDTTPPSIGKIFLNDAETGKRYNYINDSRLKVSWKNFSDFESGIAYYHVQLWEVEDCRTQQVVRDQIVNVTEVTFYQINMDTQYVFNLTATNRANLSTTITTATIFIDSKKPMKGDVKVGENWQNEISVQQSQTTLNATILIARTEDSYICPLQKNILLNSDDLSSTWYPLEGTFTPDCVIFTKTGLQIEVKIDEHILTEVVKGGVQTDTMQITEGTYTFTMKALTGKQMISSVAISRDILTIPFQFNDTLEDTMPFRDEITNGTNSSQSGNGISSLATKGRYGAGLLIPGYQIDTETNTWNVLFWAADMYNVQQQWVSINFDPTLTMAKYDFILIRNNDTEEVKWKVIFTIDDIEKATINALTYGKLCRISILGYNKDGYVPDVSDIFNPFFSEIDVASVHIPSDKSIHCKYGKPFYDGEGGIREIWAGVVTNSENQTQTVTPYALQRQYCLPCKSGCLSNCDPNCTLEIINPTELLSITLSDLILLPSSNTSFNTERNISSGADFNNLQTKSYYMKVKVVDFAGNYEEAISKAVIVDNTSPEFVQLSCVDPAHSTDEPALYQGTNSSVGAFWDCQDDISRIKKYTVCVGSSDGWCNIKPETNVGLQTSILIDGLDGLLLDENTYFLTVNAYNEADMKTTQSCNITVELESPVTKHSVSSEMFSVPVTNSPSNVAFSDRTDRLGIQWESQNNDTEFFEWEIGTNSYDADIFPRVKIGTKMSKKAAIIDGRLWLDGVNINTTVKEYVLTNWTEEEIAQAKAHGNFFNFEPGRCVHINLYSVNRAHLSSKIPVKPICMKRKNDVLINFGDQRIQTLLVRGNKLKTIPTVTNVEDTDMAINLKGTSGGLIVGLLDDDDLDGMYGSAASDKYNPFIASPLSETKTSRLLRKRFRHYSGMSFYVSPTGDTKLSDMMEISLHFNNTDTAAIPALVFWDQVAGEWRHVTEDCKADERINYNTKTYRAKVCMPSRQSATSRQRRSIDVLTEVDGPRRQRRSIDVLTEVDGPRRQRRSIDVLTEVDGPRRQRRSIDVLTEVDGPRQFSLVFISSEITQTAPIIQTTSLTYVEDLATVELKTVHIYDDEDDNVTCSLISGPTNGEANITADGKLYYKPDHDFAGNDKVEIECKETSLPPPQIPQPVRATINIYVTEVNDAPDLLFIRDNETFNGDRSHKIILPFESNTTGYHIGTFFASDIDVNDSLTETVLETSFPGANLTLQEADDLNLVQQLKSVDNKSVSIAKVFQLELSTSTDFFGVIDYGLMVSDITRHWSLPIKLTIGVLYNPCVNGQCAPLHGLPCSDFSRAESFDNFWCQCELGYEGTWCETETNECGPEPCALMFDCEDLIAGYKCNINIPKLMAILICSLLAIGLVCFAIYRKKEQLNKNMKVSNMNLHDLYKHQYATAERFTGKYGKNPFVKDETSINDDNESDTDSDIDSGTEASTNDVDGGSETNARSEEMMHGVQLESVGAFRPPHHATSILTQFKNKQMTPIEN